MSDGPGLAVVTGAGRGIGAAIGLGLAEEGWSLVLADVCADQPGIGYAMPTREDLESVAERCAKAGAAGAEVLQADVGADEFVARLDATLSGRTVGAAVAAAGVIAGGPGWATSRDAWSTVMEVNFHGARRLAEATVPAMIEAGRGRFVGISSAAALRAMPQLGAYSAAKAAMIGYIRSMAADLAGTGVSTNAICPGSTKGAMLTASAALYGLDDEEVFGRQQLMRRLLEPSEIAAAVVWLCGPGGSAVTGAVIPVDGGLSS